MIKDKKKAAAIAAVMAYMSGSAVIEDGAMTDETVAAPTAQPTTKLNVWGGNGRQAQMTMRALLQMKSFHGSKLR